LNNIIANCKSKGIARGAYVTVDNDNSIVDYCNFYNNPTDYDSDISIGLNIFYFDPKFENAITYNLSSNSEAIDAGTANYLWQDLTVLSIPDSEYVGLAPDLGAKEYSGTHTGFRNNNIQPLKMMLYPNYPNPFNPKTTINYELQITNYVDLSIYNIIGEKVFTLVDQKQRAGMYQVEWDARGFASGVYFYQLRTDAGFLQTKKLVLLK
jgi:hypothetical protein